MKFFCVFYDNHVRGDEARKRVIDAVQMEIRGDEARKPRSRNHFHKDKWRQLTYLSEQYIAHMLRCYKIGQPAPWAMVDKQTSYVIGVCGYVDWDRDLAR